MRKLWSDHVIWTREYIVAAIDGSPDAKAAATRLLKNQDDIGGAVAGFYGKDAGDKLTALLKQHILIAVDLIAAAKAGDQATYKATDQKWTKNGEEIADFLSQANPNWPKATLASMMAAHLATTTKEVVGRVNKKWDEDTAAFDEVYAHILHMSDALSDGIIKQFPQRF
jgi:Flp pilus assembly pilin Flp